MLWPILTDAAKKQGLPLSTVAAEILHLIVLEAIFAVPNSQSICFQGGTSIHLLYGGYRYSEDLDFAGKALDQDLAHSLVTKSRSDIEKNIIQFLGEGQFQWRFPSISKQRRIYQYWLHFQPQGKRQTYRVKLEFSCYPVYNPKVIPVRSDFDVLQRNPLVNGLTPSELMSEKITAAVGRPYLKGRDLFDLWYLAEILGASVDFLLVEKKFYDYEVSWSKSKIEKKLADFSPQQLAAEMRRFLPQRYRQQIQKDDYAVIRREATNVMQAVGTSLSTSRMRR